jgi:hypothetical protein
MADMLLEASLLPKTQLHGNPAAMQAGQQHLPSQQKVEGLSALLQNPLVQGLLKSEQGQQVAQNALNQAVQNATQHPERATTPSAQKRDEFLRTMAEEPLRKWEAVEWIRDPAEAKRRSTSENKPIFVELIVGRLADKDSTVC